MDRKGNWHWVMMEKWVPVLSDSAVRVWTLFIVIHSLEKFRQDCNVIGFQGQVPPSFCKSKPGYSKEHSTGVHAFREVCVYMCVYTHGIVLYLPLHWGYLADSLWLWLTLWWMAWSTFMYLLTTCISPPEKFLLKSFASILIELSFMLCCASSQNVWDGRPLPDEWIAALPLLWVTFSCSWQCSLGNIFQKFWSTDLFIYLFCLYFVSFKEISD